MSSIECDASENEDEVYEESRTTQHDVTRALTNKIESIKQKYEKEKKKLKDEEEKEITEFYREIERSIHAESATRCLIS